MTRDTDRPRRGPPRPDTDRPRSPRSSDKPAFAGGRPDRGGDKKSFGDKPFAKKTFDKKTFDKKPSATSSFGDRPARGDKPLRDKPLRARPDRTSSDRAERPAQRAIPTAPGDQVATIVQTERQRIAKLMARVGLCSRRDAEAWIVDGRVTLNGTVLTSPAMDVGPEDKILVDGIPLPAAEKTRLFLFHKPRGLVTSDHDPEGRETVADYLSENWPDGPRVVTIGRLDINTEGLLLLTNDGGLARVLELPTTGWVRRYRVRAKGETDQGILDTLRAGIVVDGVDYAGIEAKLDRIQGANCWLTMGLREGKNREIKRVLEHLGLEVNRLIRLSFGPFQLLDLPEGKVEEVKTRILRDQLGETLAAEAGVDFADSDAPIVAAPVSTPRESHKTSRRAEGAKPVRRDDTRGPRGDKPEARPRRRDDRDEDGAQPIRERPVAGTRRHVSTLRSEITTDLRKGPRKRIERGDTTDSNDRRVKVERLVTQRSTATEMPRARRGAGRLAPRDGEGKPGRGHASPSALAKRERISKSGVRTPAPTERYENRDERLGPLGAAPIGSAKVRSVRPTRDESAKPFREKPFRDRSTRDDGGARRSERSAGEEKPWRIERPTANERPRTGRSPSGDRSPSRDKAESRGPKPEGFKGAKRPFGSKPAGKSSFGGKPRDGDRPTRPAREGGGARPPGADRAAARARKSGTSKPGGRPPAGGGASRPSKPRGPKR